MEEKQYKLPDPKENPVACVILAYKVTKGIAHDDRAWDRVHWKRSSRAARDLLDICGGLRQADTCMVDIAKNFEDKGLSWTLETIVKHAHDWITKKRSLPNANAQSHRARLFQALAERSRGKDNNPLVQAAEALPDSIRRLIDSQKADSTNDQRTPESGHAK